MKLRPFAALLASSLSFVALVVACSGSNTGVGADGGTSPEGATPEPCTGIETCPQRSDGGTNPDEDGSVTKKDGSTTTPAAGPGDPCVPVSVSSIKPRVGAIRAIAAGHMVIPPTPANGSVNVSSTSAGKPSHISYDAAGSADDYTDDFSYNAAGQLSHFSHDAAGSTNDYTEDYSYTAAGLISHFSYDAAGSTADYTEDFSYTAAGLLSHWNHDAAGSTDDVTEDFSYTAAGLISHFNHDAAGSADDVTEDFSYTSAGLCSHWSFDAAGSTNDSTLDVSYSSSGTQTNLTANGPRAAGATVKACK